MENSVLLTVNELSRFDAYLAAGRGLDHVDALRLFLAYRSAAASLILEQQKMSALEVSRDMAVARQRAFVTSLNTIEGRLPEFADSAYNECVHAHHGHVDDVFKSQFTATLITITQAVITALRNTNEWARERAQSTETALSKVEYQWLATLKKYDGVEVHQDDWSLLDRCLSLQLVEHGPSRGPGRVFRRYTITDAGRMALMDVDRKTL